MPAYATSSGPSSGASSGGSSASGNANTGGANTTGANVGTGTGTGTGSSVGTSAGVSGSTGTNSHDRTRAEVDDDIHTSANLRASGNTNVGSSNNNTVDSTSNNTVGSASRMGNSADTAAKTNETIGQRINRHRGDTDLFLSSDVDASGTLNYDEYVTYSGTTKAQANAQTSFSKLDADNNGFLSEAEIRARGEGEAVTRSTQ